MGFNIPILSKTAYQLKKVLISVGVFLSFWSPLLSSCRVTSPSAFKSQYGIDVEENQYFSYTRALIKNANSPLFPFCTGTLMSGHPKLVLSAEHCFEARYFRVIKDDQSIELYKIMGHERHPTQDLAIYVLEREVQLPKEAKPFTIAEQSPAIATEMTLVGYGEKISSDVGQRTKQIAPMKSLEVLEEGWRSNNKSNHYRKYYGSFINMAPLKFESINRLFYRCLAFAFCAHLE